MTADVRHVGLEVVRRDMLDKVLRISGRSGRRNRRQGRVQGTRARPPPAKSSAGWPQTPRSHRVEVDAKVLLVEGAAKPEERRKWKLVAVKPRFSFATR